ncbi:unnamed protein product [Auanema sp. JU1783]|nr:unnamed protein product [Auanema sp. JU1783]
MSEEEKQPISPTDVEAKLHDDCTNHKVLVPRLDLGDMSSKSGDTSRRKSEQQRKLMPLWAYFSLRGFFQLIGRTVGGNPFAYITVAILLSMNSIGMYKMVLKDRIRDGYTPINAPSRYETDVIREFWNSTGDPMMTLFLLLAKDGGSMHRKEYLDEAQRLTQFMHHNFTVEHKDEKLKFLEMCHPYCNMNKVFEIFKEGFDEEYHRALYNQSFSENTNLSFPVTNVNGFEIQLERSLFGVKMTAPNSTKNSIEQQITNMDYVKVLLFIFRGDKGDAKREAQFAAWELAAYDWSLNEYNSTYIDLMVVGTEILDAEMIRDGRRMTPFFAAGFGFMISFVSSCVYASAVYYGSVDRGKILVGIGATLCPILAITSTYGIISFMGCRVNSFMLVMPFLIMGIGVDDSFLMLHSWQRMSRYGYSVVERLGMVYEEVGPSITITSLTNFLSFGIGALTPTPEIRLFCMATAIAMALTYVLQIVLFGPVLAIATRFEHPSAEYTKEATGWRKTVDQVSQRVLRFYCKLIGHRAFMIFIIGATVVYWYFGIIGIMNIKTRLDAVKILPRDSPIQRPNYILTNIIWAEYHPVTILVNSPLDISNHTQTSRFWDMVSEFESMHNAKGPSSSMIWLRDFIQFTYYGEPIDILASLFGIKKEKKDVPIDPYKANLTTAQLYSFLESPFYEHWKTFMKIKNTSSTPVVERFWFTVAYHNTSTWETRIGLMEDWREVANKYTDLNTTVWEPNGMFVDQMLSLKTVAMQTGVLTLVCMAVVCAIFIPNPCSVITASIAIASISIGVVGFLSWWNFDLDPVVMAAVLMTIGMSVDFIAHVSYHYQLTNKKVIRNGKVVKIAVSGPQEKLEHTLESVGWPMIQAGVSTICCILPLLFLASYSPSVFVAAIFLVVSWGALHGLVILPSFLGSLPDCLTNANCYRTFLSTSSEKSCRYVGKKEDVDSDIEPDDHGVYPPSQKAAERQQLAT